MRQKEIIISKNSKTPRSLDDKEAKRKQVAESNLAKREHMIEISRNNKKPVRRHPKEY